MTMQRKQTTAWLLSCTWLSAAVGCSAVASDPKVDYSDAKPLGIWQTGTAAQTRFETEGLTEADTDADDEEQEEQAEPVGAAGGPAISVPKANSASTVQPQKPVTGSSPAGAAGAAAPGSMSPGTGAAGNAGPAAPSGTVSESPEAKPAGAVTKLEFSYTTESLGGRYSPKNVGAVWVTDGSGKLVKSLEVWARIRLRYLLNYAEARGGARADVTATATLTNHKAHTTTWDLKDASGATVAPGKYTLNAEVTDNHTMPKTVAIPFDTSAGATMVDPPDSTGFTEMKVVLQ